MSGTEPGGWPPIISGAHRPRWVVCRDIVLTTLMWFLFFALVHRELELVRQALRLMSGRSVAHLDAGLQEFLLQMRATVGLIVFLVAVLGTATLVSRRRRTAALLKSRPAAVPDRELATDLGLDEQELEAIRRQKVVALDVDEQGRVSVRGDWQSRDRTPVD